MHSKKKDEVIINRKWPINSAIFSNKVLNRIKKVNIVEHFASGFTLLKSHKPLKVGVIFMPTLQLRKWKP